MILKNLNKYTIITCDFGQINELGQEVTQEKFNNLNEELKYIL